MADYKVHIPTLMANGLGISQYVANTILPSAALSIDDTPVPHEKVTGQWLNITDLDWGKKLTIKGQTNTYVVEIRNPEEQDDFAR